MDIHNLIEKENLGSFPIGIGGCKNSDYAFDSCGTDVVVFDEKSDSNKILKIENNFFAHFEMQ